MGFGRKLLTPVVVGAAVARSRSQAHGDQHRDQQDGGRPAGDGEPYPSEPSSAERGPSTPGVDADKPSEFGKQGWKMVVKRAWKETKDDNVPLLAAGVAFYAFLALFPGLIALVTLYGLVADPATVQQQIEGLSRALPPETATLLADQLRSITSTDSGSLGLGLLVSLLSALFAASGGVQNMMKAINLAYDEEETRGFVKLRGTALLLTLGAVVFLVVSVGLVAVTPVLLDQLPLGVVGEFFGHVARWVALVAFAVVGLAVLYRYAPDRDNARLVWVGPGSIAATVLWVIGSAGFSLYVSNFGKYGKTYGALAGVVVLLLWLFLTSYIVLFGAEVNAEAERQTAKDTTEGPETPLGQRGADAADTVATG